VSDREQTVTWFGGEEPEGRPWDYNGAPADGDRSGADLTGGLVNFGFFSAALWRRAWVWCLTAVLGLFIGAALYVKVPPAYHATTTVLLADSQSMNPSVQVLVDQSLAQSHAVAAIVVHELNLPESVAKFQASYTVTIVTDTALTLEVGAKTSADAVQRASALANAFLAYRADYEKSQELLQVTQLDQQFKAAQISLKKAQAEQSRLPSPLTRPAQKQQYDSLQSQVGLQQQTMENAKQASLALEQSTNYMNKGSVVIDPAVAMPRSRIRGPVLYVGGGLFGGLVVGMAIVIFGALLSRRLRRRDDVALALGASVRLSVGPLRRRRWRPTLPKRSAKQRLDMRRVVTQLHGAVPGSSEGPASLAVVAVDDAQTVARIVVSLAASCAADGERVAVADLSGSAILARLLGVRDPGIHKVSCDGAALVVILLERDEVAPVGPVPSGASPAVPTQASRALISTCSSASILLTFAVLDPAFGGDHIGTWATNAVAVVTAGESSAEKIHAVGEMIRLAGTHLDSVVLLGTDKSDESMGVVDQTQQAAQTSRSSDGRRGRTGATARPESVGPI
jgi:capsular polysaccharide biosynthesis protein